MSDNDLYEIYADVPEGYNLLDAPPGELDLFGIPQRPDMFSEPHLFEFWKKLVSPPFRPRPPSFGILSIPFLTSPPTSVESSLNWSGAIILPPRPKRIALAVAGWIVPEVQAPSKSALFTYADTPKSLAWVGIDGHGGRLPKMSLPQIGTAHQPGVAPDRQHFAWWFWWHKESKEIVKQILDFKIQPGDEIMTGLAVLISQDVLFFIKNQSTGEFRSFLARQPVPDLEPLGSSAEWVMERPAEPISRKLYPLAAYGSVDFKYCMALATDRPLAPGRLMTLADNGSLIKMREAFADPYRTVYVSRAKRRHDPDGSIGVTCTFHEP